MAWRAALLGLCAVAAGALHSEHRIAPGDYIGFDAEIPDPLEVTGPDAPWLPEPRMEAKWLSGAQYPRRATINLDLPPHERWVELMQQYKYEMIPYFLERKRILAQHTEVDQGAWVLALERQIPLEYQAELRSIVATVNHESIDWNTVLLFAAMYEMGSPMGCSEIIAATEEGVMVHGRNLDYRLVSPLVEVELVKGGIPAYVGPMFLGNVGMHTVVVPGAWSFGQNARVSNEDNAGRALQRLVAGGKLYALFVRSLADQTLNYDAVLSTMANAPLCRSMYLILAGAGAYEGAVVTRAADPSYRRLDEISTTNWYLVQTNDDLDRVPKDGRRVAGIQSMGLLTQARVNPTTILKIMYSPPLRTPGNVVLFMMAPMSGLHCSVLGTQSFNDDTSVHCTMNGYNQPFVATHGNLVRNASSGDDWVS